jgi:hypothetical protein
MINRFLGVVASLNDYEEDQFFIEDYHYSVTSSSVPSLSDSAIKRSKITDMKLALKELTQNTLVVFS